MKRKQKIYTVTYRDNGVEFSKRLPREEAQKLYRQVRPYDERAWIEESENNKLENENDDICFEYADDIISDKKYTLCNLDDVIRHIGEAIAIILALLAMLYVSVSISNEVEKVQVEQKINSPLKGIEL